MRHLRRHHPWWLGALLAVTAAQPAWAGAWTVPRNRWYVEYFYRYFGSKHVFDQEGDRHRRATTARFSDIRNELKLEYGLTDWWNLLASAPYISSHYRDDNVDLLRTGVADIYVRSKFRVLHQPLLIEDAPLVASAQFSVKIPSAYDPLENPIGDGQVDVESRLLLSYAWPLPSSRVAFVNLEAGFTARNEDPANEFPLYAEAGVAPWKRLMVVGAVESVLSVNSTNEQEENFAKWGARAIINLFGDGFATVFRTPGPTVNAEVGYNDIVAGRNTADAYEIFAKLSVAF